LKVSINSATGREMEGKFGIIKTPIHICNVSAYHSKTSDEDHGNNPPGARKQVVPDTVLQKLESPDLVVVRVKPLQHFINLN